MKVLYYDKLEKEKVKKAFEKVVSFLQKGDFKSADVKKMTPFNLYRAKLDDKNRLLFSIGTYEGQQYIFILEVIFNHDYESSRFLNGAAIDESKLVAVMPNQIKEADSQAIAYINNHKQTFHLLDKIISFDDTQDEILHYPLPNIVIGSAGSGKTALTLEKLKTFHGNILYVTLSPYLVENASAIYSSFGYENSNQQVDFLSFYEYLSTIKMPQGQEVTFQLFEQWISRYRVSHKIKDAYKVFEEFKGVLTGSVVDKPYLSQDDYLNLGVKQSIFSQEERPVIYDLFSRYIAWLKESNYFDSNLHAYEILDLCKPLYDYVVIDEVQDITNVQLMAILKSLQNPNNFLLCGDSNQIVHPNFFSWSQIKTLFYKQELTGNIIRILATNYRNTPEVTKIANQLLLVKNTRFGSIDKESTYLVQSNSKHKGEVEFLENTPKVKSELNQKTQQSTRFAVLVLRNEDKAAAKKFFQTPLLFSIQEAKGLEYENIILYNVISDYEKEFRALTTGVSKEDLRQEDMTYARAKDKSDKSLDEYKFYVNSLYVGITRAIKNLYVVESNKKHALLELLELTDFKQQSSIKNQVSSKEEWQQEARKLELQGKKEQAEAIRQQILQVQKVPWEILHRNDWSLLIEQALDPNFFNKKQKDKLFEYSLFYEDGRFLDDLAVLKYRPADRIEEERKTFIKRIVQNYTQDNLKLLEPSLKKYGLDFRNQLNFTPFMLCAYTGASKIADYLIQQGAQLNAKDIWGRTALHLAFSSEKNKAWINRYYAVLKQESIKVKIKDKLVKIDNHQAEYLLLNYMFACLSERFLESTGKDVLFRTADFMSFYEGLSMQVVPAYRRNRSYISSILSKNEINRNDKYNKTLFFRVEQGGYIPHPLMEIEIDGTWVNVYDTFFLFDFTQKDGFSFFSFSKRHRIHAILNARKMLEEMPLNLRQ